MDRWPIETDRVLRSFFDSAGRSYLLQVGEAKSAPDLGTTAMSWRETGTDRERARIDFPDGAERVGEPAFSADGSMVAMRTTDSIVRLWEWDGQSVKMRWTLPNKPHPWPQPRLLFGGDLAFSPDGRFVTIARRKVDLRCTPWRTATS